MCLNACLMFLIEPDKLLCLVKDIITSNSPHHSDTKQISQASRVLRWIRLHTIGLSLHILLTAFFRLSVQFIQLWRKKKKKRGTDSLNQVTSNFKVARFKSFFLVRDMKFQSGSQCPWAAQWFRVISLSHSLQVCQTLTAWVQFSGCLGKADSFQITASHPKKLLSLGNFYPGANWAQTYKYLWNRAGTQPKVILLQYAPADLLQPHPTTGVLDVFSALFLLQVCV